MATDRGGLNYRIKISDGFSKTTQSFREEMDASRESFKAFKKAARSGIEISRSFTEGAQAARAMADSTRKVTDNARKARVEMTQEERILEKLVREEQRRSDAVREVSVRQQLGLALTTKLLRQAGLVTDHIRKQTRDMTTQGRVNERIVKDEQRRSDALLEIETRQKRGLEISKQLLNQAGLLTAGLKSHLRTVSDIELAEKRVALAEQRRRVALLQTQLLLARGIPVSKTLLRQAGLLTDEIEKRNKALTVEKEALRANERAERRRLVSLARIADLQRRGLVVPEALRRSASLFNQELEKTERKGNSLLFTFRRLFGVLALFQGVRLVFRGFLDGVKAAITFNAKIQESELALASLFTAVGDVRNALGQTVTPAQELELATIEARRQIRLLRQDAINTQATFEELVETFQVAVAPGLVAGLTVDQIREFSIRISQAASALGVAQNQLSEEVRSILSGTIQTRTTRIATALGITNDDIRRAKELGVLFEFLNGEFASFQVAGEKALTTFTGLTGRIRDAIQTVLGLAGENLFQNVLGTLREIFDILTTKDDETGLLRPNPKAVEILKEVLDPLSDALTEAKELIQVLTFKEAKQGARAFGQTLRVGLEVLVGGVQGLIEGLSTLVDIFGGFFGVAGKSTRETAKEFVRLATLIFVLLIPLRLTISAFTGLVGLSRDILSVWRKFSGFLQTAGEFAKGLGKTFPSLVTASEKIAAALGKFGPALLRSVAAAGALLLVFEQVFSKVTGLDFTLGDTFATIKLSFEEVLETIGASATLFFKKTVNSIIQLITNPIGFLAAQVSGILDVVGGLAAAAAGLGAISEESRVKFDALISKLQGLANERANNNPFAFFSEEDLNKDRENLDNISKSYQDKFNKLRADIASRGIAGAGFDFDAAAAAAAGDSADDAGKSFRSLLDIFNDLPPQISTTGDAIQRLDEVLTTARTDARELATSLSQAISTGNLTGTVAQIQGAFDQAESGAKEKTFQLTKQVTELEGQLAQHREDQNAALHQAILLKKSERDLVFETFNARVDQVKVEKQIADLDKEIRLQQLAVRQARAEGTDADEAVNRVNSLRAVRASLELQRDAIKEKFKGKELDEQSEKILLRLATATAQIASEERDLNDLLDAQTAIERALIGLAVQRAAVIAAERVPQLRQENTLLRQQVQAEAAITGAISGRASAARFAVIEAKNALDQATLERQVRIDQLTIERDRAVVLASRAQIGSKEQTVLLAHSLALQTQLGLEKQINEAVLGQLEARLRLAELVESGNISQGFAEGLKQFGQEFATEFQIGIDTAKNAVTSFANFASTTIVDAFDPTKELDIGARLGGLLQGVAQQFLQQFIQLQIAKATSTATDAATEISAATAAATTRTLSATALQAAAAAEVAAATTAAAIRAGGAIAGGAAKGGLVLGMAEGGRVPSRAHASRNARGYDVGGRALPAKVRAARPKGLPASDTVPAWLTPGEFIFSKSAVANMGVPFLRRLHEIARHGFDTNVVRRSSQRTRAAVGMASGGSVSDQISGAFSSSKGASNSRDAGARGGMFSPSVVVPSNEAFGRMLAQGEPAMLAFLRKHRLTQEG